MIAGFEKVGRWMGCMCGRIDKALPSLAPLSSTLQANWIEVLTFSHLPEARNLRLMQTIEFLRGVFTVFIVGRDKRCRGA